MMKCIYFSKCGSCKIYDKGYEGQLIEKVNEAKELFKEFKIENFELFKSKKSKFRDRAEFRILHKNDSISYAMHGNEKKELISIKNCQIVNQRIYSSMQILKKRLQKNDILKEKLFAVEFLSSNKKDILTTLIYHKKLDKRWEREAFELCEKLDMKIIGRSRGIKIVLREDFVEEELLIDSKKYRYRYLENSFTQPNSSVNRQMIEWAKKNSKDFKGDLLELYCGHGNFTIPLSENFNKILATEISKTSIKSASYNCQLNNIKNVFFVRLSSEEMASAMNKEREFRRLKEKNINLEDFDFKTVFVDPPRAGLDEKTRTFIKRFDNIIYISCNPQTLKRDLQDLCKDFQIEKFAFFDQFPYTKHLESGVILKRKKV